MSACCGASPAPAPPIEGVFSGESDCAANPYREAIALLERDGWTKGEWKAPTGERCISRVLSDVRFDSPLFDALALDAANEVLPGGYITLVGFNDRSDTTYADVILALEKAALRYEEMV